MISSFSSLGILDWRAHCWCPLTLTLFKKICKRFCLLCSFSSRKHNCKKPMYDPWTHTCVIHTWSCRRKIVKTLPLLASWITCFNKFSIPALLWSFSAILLLAFCLLIPQLLLSLFKVRFSINAFAVFYIVLSFFDSFSQLKIMSSKFKASDNWELAAVLARKRFLVKLSNLT